MIRPCIVNGWVFCGVRPPAVAQRTWATNTADWACFASRMNSSSRNAASGCLSSTAAPEGSKNPIPLPSTLRRLCTSSESGASISQKVAWTGWLPAVSPSSLHTMQLRSEARSARLRRLAREAVQKGDEAVEVGPLVVVHGQVAAVRAVQVTPRRQAAGHHLQVSRVHGVVAGADDQRRDVDRDQLPGPVPVGQAGVRADAQLTGTLH